ncbi:hypothetical protein Save01_01334 [Streptomyces avermitilis]
MADDPAEPVHGDRQASFGGLFQQALGRPLRLLVAVAQSGVGRKERLRYLRGEVEGRGDGEGRHQVQGNGAHSRHAQQVPGGLGVGGAEGGVFAHDADGRRVVDDRPAGPGEVGEECLVHAEAGAGEVGGDRCDAFARRVREVDQVGFQGLVDAGGGLGGASGAHGADGLRAGARQEFGQQMCADEAGGSGEQDSVRRAARPGTVAGADVRIEDGVGEQGRRKAGRGRARLLLLFQESRQFGRGRVLEEPGDFEVTVQFDAEAVGDLDGLERVGPQVEHIVPGKDGGHAEHLLPDGGDGAHQCTVGRRGLRTGLRHMSVGGRRGERVPVDLP